MGRPGGDPHERVERRKDILMKKRVITLFLVAVLALFGAACDDTIEGVEEDTEEGVEEVEEEMDES